MSDIERAIDPGRHAVVHAAAGTGKTWLLTSRIVRLLLAGVAPGAILAITFTRKAAGEMQERVRERLHRLATTDSEILLATLREIRAPTDPDTCTRARRLYENFLRDPHGLRATTFHAFCQELLRRFPLEADVPPGFELLEATGEIQEAAWRRFDAEITAGRDPGLIDAFDILARLGSPSQLRRTLDLFIEHRSDWWALTDGSHDPLVHAITRLRAALGFAGDADPSADPPVPAAFTGQIMRYAALLGRHATQTHRDRIELLHTALALTRDPGAFLARIQEALFTQEGKARELKHSRALATAVGETDVDELLSLHRTLVAAVETLDDEFRRRDTFCLSRAWYRCGQRLLHHYQFLKTEHGALDFADLEWITYRLLTRSRHAEWVQYKLDRRIEHLLVDEFQDTNPTQWRLLRPLLAEMTAGGERPRSVFLVGDDKQSIYRFRRADARLFAEAHAWLAARAPVQALEQQSSRRSAPAIMQFVNDLFSSDTEDAYRLPGFRTHYSHYPELWGRVEILPLVPPLPAPPRPETALRDPLTTPRTDDIDPRYRTDAARVARRVAELIGTPVNDRGAARPLGFGDVMILLRDRTHAAVYEQALRAAGIPFLGTAQNGLHDCLEVQDLLSLLRVLQAPHHDLALANVLRSPLFSVQTEDLFVFRCNVPEPWFAQLQAWSPATLPPALARARQLLGHWRRDTDRLPVHDLLDRIFSEGDVIGRYRAATPAHLSPRVEAALSRLLDIALELDCGRYPSIARFLARIEALGIEENGALPADAQATGRVRVMTVHGAKGLEAPVVFLVDAARAGGPRDRGPLALLDWPVTAEKPNHMLLARRRSGVDARTRAFLVDEDRAARREEANLLYVAVTRARHLLCVTGCEPARAAGRGWYGFMLRRIKDAAATAREGFPRTLFDDDAPFAAVVESGAPPPPMPPGAAAPHAPPAPPDALLRPLPEALREYPRRDSTAPTADFVEDTEPDAAARLRGIAIHRMLELLTEHRRDTTRERCRAEFGQQATTPEFDAWWREACAVVDDPALREIFDPACYEHARNEVPLLYRRSLRLDRVVVHRDYVILIDYKTRHDATPANAAELARPYHDQMRFYAAGLRALWPGKPVRLRVLFTVCRTPVPVDAA